MEAIFTIEQLAGMAPDMKGWVSQMAHGMATAAELFGELNYDGPAELFSMFACVFLSPDLQRHSEEWVWQHRLDLVRLCETLNRKYGLQPHLATLLAEFSRDHGDD